MSVELKNCPFCGDIAENTYVGHVTNRIVQCVNCGGRTMTMDTEEQAIRRWNKRDDGSVVHVAIPTVVHLTRDKQNRRAG